MPADLRHEAVDLDGVPGSRAQIVERDAHLPRRRNRRGMRAQQVGQLAQHAQHFAQLGGLGRTQLVAQLDDLGRLDEHGVARRRLVVHDAADAPAGRGADRNHVAPAAHRDGGVGRALGLIERSQDGAQLVRHVLAGFAHVLARAGEILGRTVQHRAVGRDRATERALELFRWWIDTNRGRASCPVSGIEALQVGRDNAHRGEGHGELGERLRFERAARHIQQVERFRDIGNGLGPDRVVRDQQRRQLGDLSEALADGRCIGVGEASCDAGRTQRPGSMRCDARQGLGEFEGF